MRNDPTPPHDVTAERHVLGALMIDQQQLVTAQVMSQVSAADFYRGAHRTVFEAIETLWAHRNPVDAVAVGDTLDKIGQLDHVGGPVAVADMVSEVPTVANAAYYAGIVAEKAHRRTILTALAEAHGHIQTGEREVDETLAQLSDSTIRLHGTSDHLQSKTSLTEQALERLENPDEQYGWGAPWGALQHQWRIVPGWVHVITGWPNHGKALGLDTPLPTPTGWTTMGQVQAGDQLLDERGKPCRVVAATPVMYDRPCFNVTFNDHTTVTADAEHQWLTTTAEARQSSVVTTSRIAKTIWSTSRNRPNHSIGQRKITSCEPIESVPVRCIQVDSLSSLFLCSKAMIPTHNSALVESLIVQLAERHGVRTLMWAPEGDPTANQLTRMASIHTERELRDPSKAVQPFQWVNEHITWVDHTQRTTIPHILYTADAFVHRNPLDILVVDPFTNVDKWDADHSEPWDRMLNRHLTRMHTWARSRQIAVLVVAHPKQRDNRMDGTRPVATAADIAGGAMWANMADSQVSVWRDPFGDKPYLSQVHIQKVREHGPGGEAGRCVDLERKVSGRYYAAVPGGPAPTGNGRGDDNVVGFPAL